MISSPGEKSMVNCPKCGKSVTDDAVYCISCGESMHSDVKSPIEQQAKLFAQTMEQAGKKIGDQVSRAAKNLQKTTEKEARQFEQRMDRMNRHAQSWYERSFGPFGPLLESFVFLIVFRLILLVMELFNEDTPDVRTASALLLMYLLPLFVLSLLSNYTQYLSKRYYPIKVFSPLLYAIFFVLLFWIISRILYDASTRFALPDLHTAALSLENSLPTIFIFALLIGYVILMVNLPKELDKKP